MFDSTAKCRLFIGFFLIFPLISRVESHFNLFMNETETKRLLGIPGELFYVRSGIINDYALSFNIPIRNDINYVTFDWQSFRKTPPDNQIYYSLAVIVSNSVAMENPTASIAKEGTVPTKPSVFTISLACSGLTSADIDVRIQLNVTIFSTTNVTVLDLKRKKTCLKGDHNSAKESVNSSTDLFQSGKDVDGNKMTISETVFYIAIGCTCGALCLVAIALICCFMCNKRSSIDQVRDESIARPLTSTEKFYTRVDFIHTNNSLSGVPHIPSNYSSQMELKSSDVNKILGEIKIDRNLVTLSTVLSKGTFGMIYMGTVVVDDDSVVEQNVIIKTITEEAQQDQIDVMLKDACLTKGIFHDNVCSILAACLDPDQLPLLIYTNKNEKNLKLFLAECKLSEVLIAQQLVYMALLIARGMQYLHRRKIIHRDLSTRNCLIDSQLNIRITDSALARDIFPQDYHCLGDNENRPIKWMALESLTDRNFSQASDMWSFGITVWELFSPGMEPYANVDPFEMAMYLQQGYRISQPSNCPDELYSILACCWCRNPEERPEFTRMQICLQEFYRTLGRFV